MKVVDEKAWQEIRQAYITKGGSEGESIVELAHSWASEIEKLLEDPDLYGEKFRDCMLRALPNADVEKVTSHMLTEILVILSQVWRFGEELIQNLSYIEKRNFETAIAEKMRALSAEAQDPSTT